MSPNGPNKHARRHSQENLVKPRSIPGDAPREALPGPRRALVTGAGSSAEPPSRRTAFRVCRVSAFRRSSSLKSPWSGARCGADPESVKPGAENCAMDRGDGGKDAITGRRHAGVKKRQARSEGTGSHKRDDAGQPLTLCECRLFVSLLHGFPPDQQRLAPQAATRLRSGPI